MSEVRQAAPATVQTVARWIGPAERPLLSHVTVGSGAAARASGIVILPPLGYQWWTTHRTLRVLAERLAAAGHVVSRVQYHGTGDSAGADWDGDRVAAWRESVQVAVGDLRALGCQELHAVGVRLGATLALLDGADLGLSSVACWAPITSGRRWTRELRMLADELPESEDCAGTGSFASAGVLFSGETVAELAKLSATAAEHPPAPRVLLVDGAEHGKLAAHLDGLGVAVTGAVVAGGEQALEEPTEDAVVPDAVLGAITEWIGPAGEALPAVDAPSAQPGATIAWAGATVREEVVELGPERFFAIVTSPAAGAAVKPGTIVFLNTGSEPHVGPGRAWVEYARGMAAEGHRCVRVDWRGWGESPDEGRAPGRPYDATGEDDTLAIAAALRARGEDASAEPIVLVGLCASAWMALRAVLRDPSLRVIALNAQLWWKPGMPVIPVLDSAIRWRIPITEHEEAGARWGKWTALDLFGRRDWAGRWLDALDQAGAQASLVYVEGDPGILHLRTRLARRVKRTVRGDRLRIVELNEIDHSMHRTWARPQMLQTLVAEAGRLTREG
jgi:pimeloyl-ACP methyl ester carboxylesterase